ncbi:MAG: RNA-binding protein hfq [Snowella sp.]|nr:RNA-binding protein hfq [Snowella sp.]
MAEFDMGLPSVRQVQEMIKAQKEVEAKLVTNDLLSGKIRWQDPHCICLINQSNEPIVIWRHSLVFLKPKSI